MYFNEHVRKLIALRYFYQPKLARMPAHEKQVCIELMLAKKPHWRCMPCFQAPQLVSPLTKAILSPFWASAEQKPKGYSLLSHSPGNSCRDLTWEDRHSSGIACALKPQKTKGANCLRRLILPPTDVFFSEGASKERWGWPIFPICSCPTALMLTTIMEWGPWKHSWEQELASI